MTIGCAVLAPTVACGLLIADAYIAAMANKSN